MTSRNRDVQSDPRRMGTLHQWNDHRGTCDCLHILFLAPWQVANLPRLLGPQVNDGDQAQPSTESIKDL